MSQEKAQLIAPIGHFTVPGLNVSGVVTATSFSGNCTGTASSIAKGTNVVVGVMTASSFVGDVTGNVTGIGSNTDNLDVGIVTATSFAGNFTGIGSGLTGTPNVVAGVVTATKFVGNTPGTVSKLADGTNINVGVVTATKFVGNTSGLAGGISAAQNINVGVLTATGGLYGDGSGLTGAGSTAFIKQDVTAVSGTTTINLNDGNIIYLTHSNNTTIAFSNVGTAEDITIIRTLTGNTITWPAAITWDGGSAPTLIGANTRATAGQVFNLITADGGTNWYGYEEVDSDPQTFAMYGWGFNDKGMLAQNDTVSRSSPTQIPGTTWRSTSIGFTNDAVGTDRHVLASKTDGTLWSWGYGYTGSLGLNEGAGPGPSYSSPVQIPGTTWGTHQSIGTKQGASLKTDGTLWIWGNNQSGNLGLNSPNNDHRSSPVQLPGTTWSWIEFGEVNCMALKTDGTLWSWGYNNRGSLGQNSRVRYSSPVQVPGTTWATASAGVYHVAATKTDGTLWAWGDDSYGQLAQDPADVRRSSPNQIPGTNWANVKAGHQNNLATKTDGTLWGWGTNNYGQLGQNNSGNPTRVSSPVQIPGTNWSTAAGDIWIGRYTALAKKTDGTLWAWGYNVYGQLAQNTSGTPAHRSSPIQIPGTWSTFGGQGVFNMAIKAVG